MAATLCFQGRVLNVVPCCRVAATAAGKESGGGASASERLALVWRAALTGEQAFGGSAAGDTIEPYSRCAALTVPPTVRSTRHMAAC
jgi:hypothetical protein